MNKCSCGNCDLEVFDDNSDKCILHCENKSKDINLFWKAVNTYIVNVNTFYQKDKEIIKETEKEYNYLIVKYSFENVKFPKFTKNKDNLLPFENLDKDINLHFKNCEFYDEIEFGIISNANKICFFNCIFYDKVIFQNQIFKDLFQFEGCTLNSEIIFQNIIFKGVATFINTKFISVKFIHLVGEKYFLFNDTFVNLLEIDNSYFDKANFINIKTFDNKNLIFKNLENRETARIIKDCLEKQNNIIEANKFYALEMEKREKELEEDIREGKNFFEWLVFKIHGISSNHSQDWTLALFWIINLTFFYSYLNIQPNDKILVFKIIFSCIAISVIACMTIKIPEENKERRWLTTIPTTIVCYVFYGYLVETDWQLSEFSKNLNPFSIMRGDEPITLGTLIFKIIIAYLIYQLIISIRQNTRRK
ncbi:hypothetical protein [Aliarcobacter butzleri]|uniref:hypothetical protein n=1 Tax=Aliarcobacter butzleri TaxID=28197 RepID=UPI003AF8608B